ncbi:UPF0481 protein At3g47200-like [Impatiens glandulifera]|uniref:UPF0481 protein At3g47200-like n=1 Tax=Impatiens glandulifera TaxID=253017 RepID=UPI001FB14293|nr:UPF0481 protein At3g47200-like [Impatiens glandulifera]
MVAVFNKDLLSWYLITLKLKETVEAGIQNSNSPTPTNTTTRSIEFSGQSDPLQIQINHDFQNVHHLPEITHKSPPPESEWIISIKDKLDQANQEDSAGSWNKLTVYRIPQCLRNGDEKGYIPQIVSLGPYYHSRKRLRSMERHKWRAVHHILKRTKQDINLFLESVKELEERARDCYEGPIGLNSNEFIEMMVLDGCFILELFRGVAEGFSSLGYSRSDPIFAIRGSMHSIQRDMIMLENQLPLFVLDRLLGLQFRQPEQRGLVAELAIRFFDPLMPTDEPLTKTDRNKLESSLRFNDKSMIPFDPLSDQGGLHCLDVFRRSLLRKGPKPEPRTWIKRWSHTNRAADKRRQQLIHCVTELREAGIKFKKRKTDRFWDIRFENGILRLPRLLIHDGTRSLFLNLIAFEQCHLDCSNDITSYVIFMDNLIDSPEDVAYLHYCGIIEHWLGSDAEVADLFNRLCEEVVFDLNNSYLSVLSERVNKYYNHRWNTWRAILKHRYFGNPWTIVSVLAAVVLLILTFAQTFYGIYGYYTPHS